MQEPSVIHSTFVIERRYPKPPERVFLGLRGRGQESADGLPRARATTSRSFAMDFRVGGAERSRYRFYGVHPVPGRPP